MLAAQVNETTTKRAQSKKRETQKQKWSNILNFTYKCNWMWEHATFIYSHKHSSIQWNEMNKKQQKRNYMENIFNIILIYWWFSWVSVWKCFLELRIFFAHDKQNNINSIGKCIWYTIFQRNLILCRSYNNVPTI